MPYWTNADGLVIKSGTDEGKVAKVGVYAGKFGDISVAEAVFLYTDLNAFGTDTVLSDTLALPDGARVKSATFYVETAFTSGGSATLKFGLLRSDRSTAYDDDGLIAATAVASLTAGATITGSGALVNTTLANDGLLTATAGTANFTAGKGRLRVEYYIASAGTHAD